MTNEELKSYLDKQLKQQRKQQERITEEFGRRLEQEFKEFSERIEESDRAYLEQVRQEEQQRREAFQKERKEALKKNLINAQKIKAPFLRNVSIKSYLKTAKTVGSLTAEYFSVLQKNDGYQKTFLLTVFKKRRKIGLSIYEQIITKN